MHMRVVRHRHAAIAGDQLLAPPTVGRAYSPRGRTSTLTSFRPQNPFAPISKNVLGTLPADLFCKRCKHPSYHHYIWYPACAGDNHDPDPMDQNKQAAICKCTGFRLRLHVPITRLFII